ncbi:hypothetical protein LINPERHAP2_LOCUS14415 [Linum perenne]
MQTLMHCGKLFDPKKLKVNDWKNQRQQKGGKNARITQWWMRIEAALEIPERAPSKQTMFLNHIVVGKKPMIQLIKNM